MQLIYRRFNFVIISVAGQIVRYAGDPYDKRRWWRYFFNDLRRSIEGMLQTYDIIYEYRSLLC